MTTKEIAQALDGMEYPVRIPTDIAAAAKESGVVIVYGASDDLMEFEGAIYDEVGVYEGGKATVTASGLQMSWQDVLETEDKNKLRSWFANEGKGKVIEAVWNEDGYSFTYETEIPHETFEVVDEGDKYCRGIVFKLSDVEKYRSNRKRSRKRAE